MPPTFIQYQSFGGSGTSQTSPAYTFTAGNLLVVATFSGETGAPTPISVTDTLGNVYTPIPGTDVYTTAVYSGIHCKFWYKYNCVGGTGTITVNAGGTLTFSLHRVVEYSGFGVTDPLDTASFGTSFTVPPSVPLTLANANELIVAAFIIANDVGDTWLWTDLTDRAGNTNHCICDYVTSRGWGDYAGASAGAYTVTGNSGTGGLSYLGAAVAFIPGAAPVAAPYVVIPTFFQ
jgi:hypothetical protein